LTVVPAAPAHNRMAPSPTARVWHPAVLVYNGSSSVRARTRSGRQTVPRPALVQRLLASDEPLVVISAPPGYGKTTLLHQWESADERTFAWLELGKPDEDPPAFREDLRLALATAGLVGKAPIALHRREAQSGRGQSGRGQWKWDVSTSGFTPLPAVRAPVVVVLDDAERRVGPQVLETLQQLLDELPAGSKVALASRVTPHIPLGRLQAEGSVLPIGLTDLALDLEQGARLIESAGLRLSPGRTAALVELAEGWPAGLSLAARSLVSRRDPNEDARYFNGDDQVVAQYLKEVIEGLDRSIVDFLVDTSVLERFSPALCDAVRRRSGSARVIEELERTNMFLVPLDHTGDWYRYHRLFAAYLRARCRRVRGDHAAALHARASLWWERHGDEDAAVRHAYTAGDLPRFTALVWPAVASHLSDRHRPQLASWLELPTPAQLISSAPLAVAAAWLSAGRDTQMSGALTANVGSDPSAVLPDGTFTRTALALLAATTSNASPAYLIAESTNCYEALGGQSPWKAYACLLAGTALRLDGRPQQAQEVLQEGYLRSAVPMPAVAACCLLQMAWQAMDEEDLEGANSLAHRARQALDLAGPAHHAPRFALDATRALLCARSGVFTDGHRFARAAVKGALSQELPSLAGFAGLMALEARVVLSWALVLMSDHATARCLLIEARQHVSRFSQPGLLLEKIAEAECRVSAAFAASPVPDPLTPAEMRVLRYLPTYMTFEEIGHELVISKTTVKTQAIAVYRKLGVSSRAGAVRKAREQGLLSA
jgi:LuxR family transcriptional regulator, maltose regulon positive regulatory protein